MQFSETLSRLMRDTGTTAYRLAKEVGVSQSTIKNWLDGRMPSLAKAVKVAEYFNVTTDFLLGKAPIDSGDERMAYLMSLIGRLTPENQRKLLDYIDLLEGSQQK